MRIAFQMTVATEHAAEYQARHNPIWPELEQTLLEHGVRTYSIFLDRSTGSLFAYAEVESLAAWEAVAATEVCRRWWRYMAPLMGERGLQPHGPGAGRGVHIETVGLRTGALICSYIVRSSGSVGAGRGGAQALEVAQGAGTGRLPPTGSAKAGGGLFEGLAARADSQAAMASSSAGYSELAGGAAIAERRRSSSSCRQGQALAGREAPR
jgi:L-rhamnose mutarotase